MTDRSPLEEVVQQFEGMAGTVEKMREDLRAAAGPSSAAVIRMDSGGMAMIVAGAAFAVAIACMIVTVCSLVWYTNQISDLKNKDALHDAYLDQHTQRIRKLEK